MNNDGSHCSAHFGVPGMCKKASTLAGSAIPLSIRPMEKVAPAHAYGASRSGDRSLAF